MNEDTVDLKALVPSDMNRMQVYFLVRGPQLDVYLFDMKRPRPADAAIVGPFRVQAYLTRQIYPTR